MAVLLLTHAPSIRGQTQTAPQDQPPSPTSTIRVTSRLVVLDVVVLDRKGKAVSDLDRSQFSITEEGAPQRIRDFDPPAEHTMPATDHGAALVHNSSDLTKIGLAPLNILVFDELNTRWEHTVYAREQMEKYLRSQPEVLPVPTLMLAAGDARFTVLHDYTQSRTELLEAVKKHFPQLPSQMMRGGSNSKIDLLEQTLGALSQIAESARGERGHKNVIWIGSGYPSLDLASLEPDDNDKLTVLIRRVTDRMLRARITLYMVDPGGVQTGASSAGGGDSDAAMETGIVNLTGPYHSQLDFSTFATSTGGEVFANRNDTNVSIAQGIQDGGTYYTLTYTPTSNSEETQAYRRIRVRVKDPSLRVITRDGYFGGEQPVDPVPSIGEKPSNQLQFDIVSAARTRLAYTGLKVTASFVSGEYTLLVGAKDLHWQNDGAGHRIAEVTVMTVFFDAKDKKLQSSTKELKERISSDAPIGTGVVAFTLAPGRPAGTARTRFVVRDAATGLLGTADMAH